MKHTRHLFCICIVSLFSAGMHANDRINFYTDSSIITRHVASEDEKQAIANAINKFLDPVGIKLGELNLSSNESGGKTASGNVSFFGFDNIALKADFISATKVKSISAAFPEAATLTIDKLTKFLSGKSLSSFLPKSFPLHTGISLKDFLLEFDDQGDSLSQFNVNFAVGNYSMEGFDGFTIEGMTIGFTLDKPTSAQKKATATISGDGKIGAIPISLSANMSSDPDDLLFTFTASGINIPALLNTFLSDSRANSLLRFIPPSFKSKEISSITVSINPTSKNFSGLSQTSFGEAEIQFNAATEESKSTMLFALAPPAGFKFSQIAGSLSPMDAIELSGTAIIISTLADEDVKTNLSALKDEGEIKVEQGVNLFSSIKLSDDLAKLLKVNAIKLKGTCNETFTNMSMDAALDLNIPMGASITMKEVLFGIRLGTVNPIELSLGGKIEAKIGNDLVGFNASFAFAPVDQKISGEFFMNALKKQNAALVTAKTKDELPEWTNPFGIPGVGLRRLGVSAGIDFKNPILISSLGFTGAARLGTVTNRAKHIEGDATIVVDITKPTNSLIDVTMKNMTILAMIEAFVENASIQGQLRTMLNTGIDQGRVLVVPVDGMKAFGKTYNKGVAVSGQLSLGGIKAYGDFSLNDAGVSGAGSMDAINWGNGAFIISGRTTDKPQFSFSYTKGSVPSFFIDGKISLLGISSETTASLDATGFSFTTTGKIANAFEATLEGKGNFSESAKGIYVRAALRNDLVSQMNQLVTGKINEAIQTTKTTFQNTRNALAKSQSDLKYIDDQIISRTKILQGQKAADVQKIRDEAIRQMNEKQAFINTCLANNAASQKRINELVNWYDAFEKAGLYSAIAANNTAIESARAAYAVSMSTVNATADVVEAFPNDPELIRLYLERGTKQIALQTANAGVDIAEGVSVGTLEATRFVMNGVLGGVFDIKSAEFSGTFGLNNQYKINTALNFTLAGKPYNMIAEIDFTNLAASAGKIATDVLGGTLIKPGFASTFSADLKKPVSNVALVTAAKTLSTENANITVVKPITTAPATNISVSTSQAKDWANKLFRIENLWQSGQRINIEKGPLVCTVMFDGAWSAQWIIKPIPGTNYYWIENKWKGGRLNVEKGALEASAINDGAWSAQWELKKIGANLFWIENRWKTGQRINIEKGKLECSAIEDGANSAMWYIRVVQ
ncbi:MAG: RICIN domain-containing protein [Sphingobacteriales bacterium]|nr:RICIN domain-containing protein [Sphingobacteriales bacterium]